MLAGIAGMQVSGFVLFAERFWVQNLRVSSILTPMKRLLQRRIRGKAAAAAAAAAAAGGA